MRNLKRALSLAMASIMLIGMMVIGTGAVSIDDFSDSEKIVNKEAVIVLTTLGVINGKDDGSYDPEGTVTRAQMAKMICYILNGGKDPQLGETVKNTYTDTVGHWAAPYIEYCTTTGIVAGKGDGTFNPEGTVTVAEAGKMLLVALGYNAGVEGYVGSQWQINTDVRANALRLYDGLETLNTNVPLTRDNAAQMCYNALDVHMVTYNYVITGTADNSISTKPQINDKDKGTLLWEKFGAVKVVGVVTGNGFADLSVNKTDTDKAPASVNIGNHLDADKSQIAVINHSDDQSVYTNKEYTFTVTTGEEELGKAIYMYVKPANNSTNTLKATVIGSAILSDDNVIVTDASGDTVKDVADDNNLDLTADTRYVYNYGGRGAAAPANKDGVKGIQKTIVDVDSDGDVDYVLLKEMGLGKVTQYTEAKNGEVVVGVQGGYLINKDKADIIGFEDVEKDDMVLTAYMGGRLYVQKADTVTGKIDAYKQADVKSADNYLYKGETYKDGFRTTGYTVDGTAYNVSYVQSYAGSDITPARRYVDKTILSSDATFYMDLEGNVIAYGEVNETAYKYAYVWGADVGTSSIDTARVKVTLEDGKTGTYNISSNSEVKIVRGNSTADPYNMGEEAMAGNVYGYTLTSGNEIKLYLPKGGAVANPSGVHPEFTKGLTNIHFSSNAVRFDSLTDGKLYDGKDENDIVIKNTYYSNNSTTFFYVTTKDNNGNLASGIDKVTVYNGRNNAPTLNGKDGTALLALNNRGDVGSAAFTDVTVTESAGDHMFVFDANYVWDEYGYVNAFLNGETEAKKDLKAALVEDGEIQHNPLVEDGIYLYKIDSKGNYELTKPDNSENPYYFSGVVTRVNKGDNTFVIERGGNFQHEFRLASDSIVIDYDTSHSSPIAYKGGSISEGDDVQVIVNNATDSEVLMVGIMDRNANTNAGNGPAVNWDDPANAKTITVFDDNSDVEAIRTAFRDGYNVIINGDWTVRDAASGTNYALSIPSGRTLFVKGNMDASNADPFSNSGTLMVYGQLKTTGTQSTLGGTIKAVSMDLAAATTAVSANSTVTVTGEVETNGNALTINGKGSLYAGSLALGTGALTVDGHCEVGGQVVTTGNVVVNSNNTLAVTGLLQCNTLTVGASGPAKIEAGSVKAATVTMTNGTLTTNGKFEADTLNISTPATGDTVALTVKGDAAVGTGGTTAVNSGATVSVNGKLAVNGNLTINGSVSGASIVASNGDITVANGTLKADSVALDTGKKLAVTGKSNVSAPTVKGEVDTSGAASDSTINAGTSKDSVVILSSKLTENTYYNGEVKIESGAEVGKDVTVTFNGKVSGLENLIVTNGSTTSKVVFSTTAEVTGTFSNFVSNNQTAHTLTKAMFPGSTFVSENGKFVAKSGTAYYVATTTSAILDSASLYV